mgnify:CR=1 FL=1
MLSEGVKKGGRAGTIRLTTAQAMVRFLAAQYVERDGREHRFVTRVLGIFGHGNVAGLGQALEESGELLPFQQAKNEQAMVHTAAAYARMRRRLQIMACTSSIGPGATNMITGAAAATINRIPVLLLPGDVFASRRPDPVLQQLEHPQSQDVSVNDAFRPVSKYWDRIHRPEQLLRSLPEAIRVLTDPAETGTVTLCLPQDVQAEAWDFPAAFFEKRVWRIPRAVPAPEAVAEAAHLILQAKRPLIIAGGGVTYSEASQALDRFASEFGIPVCETQAGKGALPWDHPWQLGAVGANGGLAANRAAATADLVIAIGTRLTDFTTASHTAFQHPDVRFISLNVTARDAYKLGALPLVGDARAGLEALAQALAGTGYRTDAAYQAELRAWQDEWRATVDRQRQVTDGVRLTQANVIGLVNEAARPEDVVVCAAGSMPGDLVKLWRAKEPGTYHVEYGYSVMGYEIAGGLGVKLAEPDREVYVLVGDGSYLMMSQEIVTAIQERLRLIIVLVDNHGYQSIRGLQMSCGSPSFGNEFRYRSEGGRLDGELIPIDFAKNAESLGARAYRVSDAEGLRRALAEARETDRTVLIHVEVDKDARVPNFEGWWDVPVAEVSGQEGIREAYDAYREGRARVRNYF